MDRLELEIYGRATNIIMQMSQTGEREIYNKELLWQY